MVLELWKNNSEIKLEASIDISESVDKNICFELADGFKIEKITNERNEHVEFNNIGIETGYYPYEPDKIKYSIINRNYSNLKIYYSGFSYGEHTMINSDILSLNRACSWFPSILQKENKNNQNRLLLHLSKEYIVMSGEYSEDKGLWVIDEDIDKIFLIAFRNYRMVDSDKASIYYYGKENDHIARDIITNVDKLDYYFSDLYKSFNDRKINIYSLPIDINYGGYNYKGNLIYDRFLLDFDDENALIYKGIKSKFGLSVFLTYAIGHELAHNWCDGAEGNWQAWLNETTADWSSFSFLIKNGYSEFVDELIQIYMKFEVPELIKTEDKKLPHQYHIKGPILFFKLYKKYGISLINNILKAFVGLKIKTTENLIKKIEIENKTAAEDIEKGIEAELIKDMVL